MIPSRPPAIDFWSRMSAAADRAAREAEVDRKRIAEERQKKRAEEIRQRLRDAGLSDEKIATLERWIGHDEILKAR